MNTWLANLVDRGTEGVESGWRGAGVTGPLFGWLGSELGVAALVQGISEAFPVSSSFHLLLVHRWLGKLGADGDQTLALEVGLHLGSLGALMILFWPFVADMAKGLGKSLIRRRGSPSWGQLGRLCVMTLPAVVVGGAIKCAGLDFRTPLESRLEVMAAIGATSGSLLYLVDRVRPALWTDWRQGPWSHSVVLGIAQAVALIPGVSRLGMCLLAGRFLGYSLPDSARLGFLMAIPVIAGSVVLTLDKLVVPSFWDGGVGMAVALTAALNLGFMSLFLGWVHRRSCLGVLALYRLALWALLLGAKVG